VYRRQAEAVVCRNRVGRVAQLGPVLLIAVVLDQERADRCVMRVLGRWSCAAARRPAALRSAAPRLVSVTCRSRTAL
jgi:hypothetical protein